MTRRFAFRAASLLVCAASFVLPLRAFDDKAVSDTEQLKQMLLDQQAQINELRRQLADQKKTSDAVLQAPAVVSAPAPQIAAPVSNDATAPLDLKIGNLYITPIGFMDMTGVSRSTNPGTGITTNFGGIPYGNTQAGSLTETHFSVQNSRLGARFDTIAGGAYITGYWESDFLGQLGNPPNGGLAVTSNPYVFRMRLFWVDVTKGRFEFLAGQSWSLMTPNRTGISPFPKDVFYSQNSDSNYQAGMVWARVPGFRFVFHPNDKVAMAVALENSEPYVGGANGASVIIAPAAMSSIMGTQVNNGASGIASAALMPDVSAKIAFDPTARFHFEVAGVAIVNKISNPASTPVDQTFQKTGEGGSVNMNFALTKNLRLVTNNFYSAGGGRYIFGQAPDFIIRADGSLSLVHSGSTASGFEWTRGKSLYYTYYGGIYIAKNMAFDANGKTPIGYGSISSDGQNRAVQEFTAGMNRTLMKDVKWGALNLMFQYSYLQRNPWLAAVNAPDNAHLSMGYVTVRYTLPGAPPVFEK